MSVKISGNVEVNVLDHVWYFEGDKVREGVLKAVFRNGCSSSEQLYVGDNLYAPYQIYPDRLSALTARRIQILSEETTAEQQLRRSRERLQVIQKQIQEC